ncbi:MAG: hypothetical protein ABEI96_01830 [Haloarculaceae archaeon]
MGRTLLGIDLDASPLGGLVASLLDEDDLAKLARTDGGRSDGDSDVDDASVDGSGIDDSTAGEDTTDQRSSSPGTSTDADEHGTSTDADDGRRRSVGSRLRSLGGQAGSLRGGTRTDDGRGLVARVRKGLLVVGVAGVAVGLLAAVGRRVLKRFESGATRETADAGETREPSDVGATRETADADAADDEESPLGELVALALLALVAALVRKFGDRGAA